MRLVFAGTPDVAVPSLQALLASGHEVLAVLTRPDASSGRGRRLQPAPVRAVAEEAGVEVLTPRSTRDPALAQRLAALRPDVCPVVAYGGLVPPALLGIAPHGWVNLHFSLLPAWRGAAPVQHAILAGDEVTGACTFVLEEGLDTGPVLGCLTEPIRPRDTAGELLGRLAGAGAGLLVVTLDGLERGELRARPQPAEGVSSAPKLTVEDARVDWSRPAYVVDRRVRGCTPTPGAWTTFRGGRLQLQPVRPVPDGEKPMDDDGRPCPPGTLVAQRRQVLVAAGAGAVELGTVVPEGRKAMPAADWARGVRPEAGERLG